MAAAKGCVHNFDKICLMLDMCKWVSILEKSTLKKFNHSLLKKM